MIKHLTLAAAFTAAALTAQAQEIAPTDTIYEIAIQEVKPDMHSAWEERRATFLAELDGRQGNERDWTFPAFFTFPQPGPNPVYIGITRWSELNDFNAAAQELMPTAMAGAFFETVNMQAFVQAKPLDGTPFHLEEYIHTPNQVLEVAVRRPLDGKRTEFDAARDAFFWPSRQTRWLYLRP